MNLFDEAGT
jgi:hypothetical protein